MDTVQRRLAFEPKFLTLGQFCERYGCSRSTAYRIAKRREITILKRGRSSMILREQAEAWAESLPALGA